MSNTKHQHLRKSRTLNPHPEKVTAPLFSSNTFFDPCDLLQVRYEMVRAHVPPTTLKELSAQFGMSVATCVRLKRKYEEGGLQALIPRERGPKGAHKITPEMLEFARNYRKHHGKTGIRELTEMVNAHFKVSLHFTGLHRALSKKKLVTPESTMELDKQSVQRYEQWRRQWFLQTPAQAICLVHQHGMAGALHLTAPVPVPDPAPVPVRAAVPDEFLQQAVFMIRSILPSTYSSNVNPFQL